jgi:hypothetical protein
MEASNSRKLFEERDGAGDALKPRAQLTAGERRENGSHPL